ncbi:MAG: hypothetical protein ACTSYM_02920 [Candidatus Baldrarchaeia archaeon]
MNDKEDVDIGLKKSEIAVYWVVFEKGPLGPREVQRFTNFTSPSKALYHLEKLKDMGILKKNRFGKYYVVKCVNSGILRFYLPVRNRLIPRALIYAVLVTLLNVILLLIFHGSVPLIFFTPSLLAVIILWYETFDLWKMKKELLKG